VSARRLTIVLTEPQYEALAGAVASRGLELDDGVEEGDADARTERAVLQRAWTKINLAWYDRTTPAARHE
jgi:hypothetical protein